MPNSKFDDQSKWHDLHIKGAFFSESEIRFSNLPISKKNIPKNYPELEIWKKMFTDMGGNFKFQAQDSFLE